MGDDDAGDPFRFKLGSAKAQPFDIAEDAHIFRRWKGRWAGFLSTSGVSHLTEGDGNADAKRIRREEIEVIKKSALLAAISNDTEAAIEVDPANMETADTMIAAIEKKIKGDTNTSVAAYNSSKYSRDSRG